MRPGPAGHELPRARRDDRQPRGPAAATAPRRDRAVPGRARLDRQARRALRASSSRRTPRSSSRSSRRSVTAGSPSARSASRRRCRSGPRRRAAGAEPADQDGRRSARGSRLLTYRPLFSGPRSSARPSSPSSGRTARSSWRAPTPAPAGSPPATPSRSARTGRRARCARGSPRICRRAPCAMPRGRRRRAARLRRGDEVMHPHEVWWISTDQGARRHQPGDGRVRLHDLARAQGARPDAAPLRPEPRRPVRAAAADRRPDQARPQGGVLPGLLARAPLHPRAGDLVRDGARRLQRHPLGRRLDDRRLLHRRRGRERADLADPDLRARLDRHLRLHRRRLGLRLEVLDPRLDAHVRAARLLRGLARALGARRRHDGPVAEPGRDRRQAAGDGLVLPAAVRRARDLPARRDRRDVAPAVRPARGRHRARRRVPHRVLGHALGPLPDGRVHQHDRALGPLRHALLRRLALPVGARRSTSSGRSGSSPSSAVLVTAFIWLRAIAAAAALRPADALRLEGAAARSRPSTRSSPPSSWC